MLSKERMQKMGISSPDIADTLAFLFMERVGYAPASDTLSISQQNKDAQEWHDLSLLASKL